MNAPLRRYALIPAAGSGSRMESHLPKQYHPLAGATMLWHAIQALHAHPQIDQIFVVLAADDVHYALHDWSAFAGKLQPMFCGGATRSQSVLNGLRLLAPRVHPQDWILVHDAARPCLNQNHLQMLFDTLRGDEVGGLLAIPVADTLKRADAGGRVVSTEPREHVWQAQTPQMFRYGVLLRALEAAGAQTPTDEARAVEHLGMKPKLVNSDILNLKVTYPSDFKMAEFSLQQYQEAAL